MGEGRLWHSLGTDLVPLSTSASDGRAAIDLEKVLTALQPSARLLIDAMLQFLWTTFWDVCVLCSV